MGAIPYQDIRHSVIHYSEPDDSGSELYITASLFNKSLLIPEKYKIIGLTGDNLSRGLTFCLDSYTDLMELEKSVIEVHYENAAKERDGIWVKDVQVKGETVLFTVPIPSKLVKQKGEVTLWLYIHNAEKIWKAGPATLTVLECPDLHEEIGEEDKTVQLLNSIMEDVEAKTKTIASLLDDAQSLHDFAADAETFREDIDDLDNRLDSYIRMPRDRIVETLPDSGVEGVTYYIQTGTTGTNRYDEYKYINGGWELLSAQHATNADIDEMLQEVSV